MRKIFTLSFLTIICCQSFSQLYVSSNSFVYNKGAVVFVNRDVNLQNNGNLYLRNEGQLIQGLDGSTYRNTGLGKVSVFQEGTVNNYAYNYWCSPVGNASATLGNESFGITMLNRPTTLTASTPITTTTSNNGTTSSTSLNIAKYWIWKYLSSNVYDPGGLGWIHVQDASTLLAGEGFTMKGSTSASIDNTDVGEIAVNNPGNAQRYDFRGKANNGDISVGVGLGDLTLTGNPYPSALHVNAFLLDPANADCTGIAYYWEQDKTVNSHQLLNYRGGYGSYSPVNLVSNGVYVAATFDSYNIDGTLNTSGSSSGLSIIRKYAPIGQGFMIQGTANGSVTLKNSYRTFYKESNPLNQSQFERVASSNNNFTQDSNSNDVPHLRINAIMNDQFTRQIALILVPEATDGIDRGIDAKSPADASLPNDMYFVLNDDRYIIEGVSFDVNKRIPLGIKSANNSNFKFSLANVINFDENQDVFIYDDLDQSYHNIKNGTYEVNLQEGVYNNRFEVTFTQATLNIENPIKDNMTVIQNNNNAQLQILNPNLLETKSIALYDISGKTIFNKNQVGTQSEYSFSTATLSDGVYIVNINTKDNQGFSQKVIIENIK
jgi:hypothetical protein